MRAEIDNFSIHYVESGSPNGIALVFIHGFPFSYKLWEPQIQALPNSIRAIAYDIRGHGLSEVGDGHYTIEFFVDDLIGLINYLKIEKAILCGLSMGGYIALRTIERNPEKVCGLILCDTKSEADTNEAKITRSNNIKIIKQAGIEAFADNFLKQVFWKGTFEKNPEKIEFIKKIILSTSPIAICSTLLALAARTDTTKVLPMINVPSCIIVGEHDALTPPTVAENMHHMIKNSEFHIIPEAGHLSNLENSEIFNKILIAFLKKNFSC